MNRAECVLGMERELSQMEHGLRGSLEIREELRDENDSQYSFD